ncbi:MAG TPA: Gfo/Idh/MocA family oxidoreductase [Candidatus Hydrogenedentes bacterium]|nr:Gfo/Idh/MocA family oxidoreductase [Candidatus Hydrogenedentota bacterium]
MKETIRTGVIMNGVTGRMGMNQHLERSLMAIRAQGGTALPDGRVVMPEPLLVGRNPEKLRALAEKHGGLPWSTDLDACLSDPAYPVYFDAQTTLLREGAVSAAIAAGKHIYCEKPSGATAAGALGLFRAAEAKGVRHGVVQDKLWLPGLVKLRGVMASGALGKVHSVKADFGYWVFTGEDGQPQRPSWNYKKAEGGGIISDMLCHWRYLIDNLFGPVTSVCCLGATHIPRRLDEAGHPYDADAEDAAYMTAVTAAGIVCQFNSSWTTRVRRDDLLTVQVDGDKGSAVAGLRECRVQAGADTPRPVWNPDIPSPIDFFGGWKTVPETEPCDNAFKAQWELFLRHLHAGEPFRWNLMEGAKGVQFAELGYESWRRRAWVDVPAL